MFAVSKMIWCIQSVSSNRVFILGPSHHVYLPNCALSSAAVCQTPLYNMEIDREGCAGAFKREKIVK